MFYKKAIPLLLLIFIFGVVYMYFFGIEKANGITDSVTSEVQRTAMPEDITNS